ncbi:MAG: RNA-binding S4 domain-containing protein, partial [Coprococcus catus]|nr:RNA-binding S4 domain-containing protein [Coprococcus catus]
EACDAGRVMINGKTAKAGTDVKVGDVIEIGFGTRNVKVEVLDVQETTRKEDAKELFRYL